MKHCLKLFCIPLLAALSLATLQSCVDTLPTGYDADVIMPLKVGNTWVGRYQEFDRDGNMTLERLDTIKITSMNLDGDIEWYGDKDDTRYMNQDSGLYLSDCSCSDRVFALYPASEGTIFSHMPPAKVLIPGQGIIDQKVARLVASTDSLVRVPAGEFRTYHYQPILLSPVEAHFVSEQHDFYSPGIGPVLIETYYGEQKNGDPLKTRWELLTMTLK